MIINNKNFQIKFDEYKIPFPLTIKTNSLQKYPKTKLRFICIKKINLNKNKGKRVFKIG